jgi:hypothetical protein
MQIFPQLQRQLDASGPDSAVQSWDDLGRVVTAGLPLPIVKAWVEAETGATRFTRLLESEAETNLPAGILRPNDYDPVRPRVWFLAA